MISKVNKIKTKSQLKDYAQEIFDLYANSVGELNVTEKEESFIKELASSCVGFFSDKDIFDVLKILRSKKLLTESILEYSRIHKVSKSSNPDICEAIKGEVEELTCNISTKHIKDSGEVISSYEANCFTIPSLKSKITIGENISNIIYKKNGAGILPDIVKNSKPSLDFSVNNLIILHKKEYTKDDFKEFINIIIVPQL